jgi:hypothetical protein
MDYLALLVPAMTLAALPLLERLERWAFRPEYGGDPGDAGSSGPMNSGELG